MRKVILGAWLAVVLVGCSSLGLIRPQSLPEQIAYADKTVQSVAEATDQALLEHSITPDQARKVSAILHEAVPFLDTAKTTADASEANRNLQLAIAILNGLDKFVKPGESK